MTSSDDQRRDDDKNDAPLSLYGMDPAEALKKALSTPPPRKDTQSGDDSAKK